MKKNTTLRLATFLMSLLFTAIQSEAQQPEAATYSYKIYQAPNKNYGYDILRNGKIVYHEFASLNQPQNISQARSLNASQPHGTNAESIMQRNTALVKSEHAEKAALLAIEKIKRKESPQLSQDEFRKIIAQ